MKKGIIYLVFAAFLMALAGCDQNELLKQQLEGKKKKMAALEKQIEKLESMVQDTNAVETAVGKGKTVSIKEMQPDTFRHFIEINSKALAENDAMISPEMGGQIKAIYVVEGQRVAAGQILVALNTEVTQRNIEVMQKTLSLTDSLYQKQKSLYNQGIGSEVQFLQAKTTYEQTVAQLKALEAQKNMSIITAPFSGIVDKIFVKKGELGAPGMPILHLVNLQRLKVYGDLSEDYLTKINKGMQVDVIFPLYNDYTKSVPIHRTGSVIDDNSRTFAIELKVANYDEKIKPNSISTIRINDYINTEAFIVPSNCVQKDLEGSYIYKAVSDTADNMVAIKAYVKPGVTFENQMEIESGIEEGDKVVAVGYNLISEDGTILNIKE